MVSRVQLVSFIILSFAWSAAFAQSGYRNGVIVLTNLDTVKGYIMTKEWERNPKTIEFKKEQAQQEEQVYTINDVNYFAVDGFSEYKRFTVKISMNDVGANKDNQKKEPRTEMVWLKVIGTGKYVTLYSYKDDVKIRFFMASNLIDTPVELQYELYKENGVIHTREIFKNQLSAEAGKHGILSKKITMALRRARYTDRSLLDLIDVINGTDQQAVSQDRPKNNQGGNFFAGAGVSIAVLKSVGQSEYLQNDTSDPSYSPYVSIGYDLYPRRQIGSLFFRVELMATKASIDNKSFNYSRATPIETNIRFIQTNGIAMVKLLYNFINSQKIRVNVGGGVRVNFSSYKDQLYTAALKYPGGDNVFDVQGTSSYYKTWVSVPVRSAIIFNKKFELGIDYTFPTKINDGISFQNKLHFFQIGLSYHF